MMTPDSRPIGVLTAEILATASHWCIRWSDKALAVPAREVTIFSTVIDAYGLTFGSGSESKTTCYPCTLQPNGLVVPEPWPVLDGEDEIEEWSALNIASAHKGYKFVPGVKGTVHAWWDGAMPNGRYKGQIKIRSGYHPAPRKGKTGITWVWEADKC